MIASNHTMNLPTFSLQKYLWIKKIWPTSEHYFQAQKFINYREMMEIVRRKQTPREAFEFARENTSKIRIDWNQKKDEVMLTALRAKFSQHPELQKMLKETGSADLVEHTKNDSYWGDGGNGCGQNKLGKLLMQVREELNANLAEDNDLLLNLSECISECEEDLNLSRAKIDSLYSKNEFEMKQMQDKMQQMQDKMQQMQDKMQQMQNKMKEMENKTKEMEDALLALSQMDTSKQYGGDTMLKEMVNEYQTKAKKFELEKANLEKTCQTLEKEKALLMKKEEEESIHCVVCYDKKPTRMFSPCNHVCLCRNCSVKVNTVSRCFICNEEGLIKPVYF